MTSRKKRVNREKKGGKGMRYENDRTLGTYTQNSIKEVPGGKHRKKTTTTRV